MRQGFDEVGSVESFANFLVYTAKSFLEPRGIWTLPKFFIDAAQQYKSERSERIDCIFSLQLVMAVQKSEKSVKIGS